MKTFSINTLGCKVNQYDSQQIRQLLEQLGLIAARTCDAPDLIVVNTCCVTQTASAKSRQCIRKSRKLNPAAVIAAVGCLPTARPDELSTIDNSIQIIDYRCDIGLAFSRLVAVGDNSADQAHEKQLYKTTNIKPKIGEKSKEKITLDPFGKLPGLKSFKGQTRAFLKVQDGCDGFCTYCIVPKARPKVHSKNVKDVLNEAEQLVRAGHKEIVVTGVCLGAYGEKTTKYEKRSADKLPGMLGELAKIDGLERIRLSSLWPGDVTGELLDVFCNNRNILPHLHLSLQSGSNEVLEKMRRGYSAEQFFETTEMIKHRLDQPAITADIIVGFPGETEANFNETMDLARQVGFAKIHIFPFSPRQGTTAAKMAGKVQNSVVKERVNSLNALELELREQFNRQFIGRAVEVLIESAKGPTKGRSERYFMTYLPDAKGVSKGQIVRAEVTGLYKDGAEGREL